MVNITKNLTSVNYRVANGRNIDYIVMHYFGALGTAEQTCAFFKSTDREASAHYFVDDESIWQCVEDYNIAWHCGDCGVGAYKNLCYNSNSIGIEMRPYKINPATLDARDKDWYITDQTLKNAAELVKTLMAKYGIDADHVIRHYDVTAKWCPRPMMGDDINAHYDVSGNAMWEKFKAALTAESEDEMVRYATINDVPDWGKPTIQKLMTAGALKGDSEGNINISDEMLRVFVVNDRMGLYK